MQVVSLLKDKKLSTTPSFHENCIIIISFIKLCSHEFDFHSI